jgi:sugar-specific transcriptional regulator TrmB
MRSIERRKFVRIPRDEAPDLYRAVDPEGPENLNHLKNMCQKSKVCIRR